MALWDRLEDRVAGAGPADGEEERADQRRVPRRRHGDVRAGRRRRRHGRPSERQRVAQLVGTDDVLRNFPADDLRRRFEENVDKLTADFGFGEVSMLQEIAKAGKKPAEARGGPDRDRHRRRRRPLRRGRAGRRPRGLLRARPAPGTSSVSDGSGPGGRPPSERGRRVQDEGRCHRRVGGGHRGHGRAHGRRPAASPRRTQAAPPRGGAGPSRAATRRLPWRLRPAKPASVGSLSRGRASAPRSPRRPVRPEFSRVIPASRAVA
ncbi:hypothetical protein SGLAM104S_02691 [Streptomyces glaucescens]